MFVPACSVGKFNSNTCNSMQERGGRTSALFRIPKVLSDIDLSYSRAHGKKGKVAHEPRRLTCAGA